MTSKHHFLVTLRRGAGSLPLVAALLLAAVPEAAAQTRGIDAKRTHPFLRQARPPAVPVGGPALVPRTEGEPNNDMATANLVTVGDVVSGVLSPAGDVDFVAFALAAGARLELEVEASRAGSDLDSWLTLYSPDGTRIAENDDALGLDSRIRHTAAAAGRYRASIHDYGGRGGATYTYQLHVREVVPAPGDPTTLYASDLGAAWNAVAAPGGAFYVVEWGGSLRRVAEGNTSTVATGFTNPRGVAIDGFGNLLVADWGPSGGTLISLTPDGERTQLVTGLESAAGVAVGPDGDLWVGDPRAGRIRRYDPFGVARASIDISGTPANLMDLVFSPSGELHFSDFGSGVFRIVDGRPQRVIGAPEGAGGIAFDRDGYLYMGSPNSGIHLYDPNYRIVHSPFAT